LFIAGGVSSQIIVRVFNPLAASGELPAFGEMPGGLIPSAISYIGSGQVGSAMLTLMPILATIVVFLVVIYAQAINVEIPLAFGSLRGFGRNWPLKFIYTSNIPVILAAALLANIRMLATMLSQRGVTFLGTFDAENQPVGGLVYYLTAPYTPSIQALMLSIGVFTLLGVLVSTQLIKKWVAKTTIIFGMLGIAAWLVIPNIAGLSSLTFVTMDEILRFFSYSTFMVIGAVIFSLFWVNTAGMDSRAVAKQIESIGMQIPGFRRDPRISESVLQKYIPALTVMGAVFVGVLAAYADTVNALGTGTGILLTVMIVYQMYEQIAMQNLEDMHPAMRKFFGK
jgi:preprotein translocase subunit SecY